jgi:hypothetical protein
MAGGSVRDALLALTPKWLQGTVGAKLLFTIGYSCDVLLDKLNQGVRMHIPTYGDASGLPNIGADRVIPQGPNEPPGAYAQRLKVAYDDWQRAGSARSLMRQFLGYVSPATPPIRVVGLGLVATGTVWDIYLAGANAGTTVPAHVRVVPSNWNWDGNTSAWYRAWVIIDSSSAPYTCPKWGDGHKWGDGTRWGFTAASYPAPADIATIVALWKTAGVQVVNVIVSYDSTLFDPAQPAGSSKLPDGNWAGWYELSSGTSIPSRSWSAAYLPGA